MTLNELRNEANPSNWLFRFVYDQGGTEYEYIFYLTDIATSDQQKRYNLFNLTDPTDVNFDKVGDYHYYIYQMPNGGSVNYTEGLLCEQGKAKIKGTATVIPAFNPNTNSKAHG